MKVSCQSCGAKYTIADEKVRGRRVKVRCKTCGTPIVVDGAQDAGESNGASKASTKSVEPTASRDGAKDRPSQPSPFAVRGTETWSVNISDTDSRDMTSEEIVAAWNSGVVTDDAFVWKDGMGDWTPVLEVPELRALIQSKPAASFAASDEVVTSAPVAPAVATASKAVAKVAAKVAPVRAAAGSDLFSSAAHAGSEEDAAAMASSTASYKEQKAAGARNENSVLFSLDALKAGFVAPAGSAPAAGRPAPSPPGKRPAPKPAEDPFGMDLSGVGGLSVGGPGMFSPDAQALLTAPAAPDPPKRSLAQPITTGLDVPEARAKSRLGIAIGAAAVLLIGGVIFAASGGEDEAATAENKIEESKSAASNETEKSAAEVKPEEPTAEQKAAEEEKKDVPDAAASAKAPTKTVAVTRSTTKSVSGTPTAKKEVESPKTQVNETPSSGVATFNKGAAISALSTSASQATSCKRPGGPTGTGKVQVTFAPSGRVTSATVTGSSFGGTAVGGCVASVFRRARVPAFSGNAVTVSKSFTISP